MAGLNKQDSGEGVSLITRERLRQITQEGYTPEHDQEHTWDVLSDAGAVYALSASWGDYHKIREFWPWDMDAFKPVGGPDASDGDRLKDLVRAGALIAAAIDRLLADG